MRNKVLSLSVLLLAGLLTFGCTKSSPAAPTTLVWDGRDEAGRVVAAGVYAWRIPTPAGAGADKANARILARDPIATLFSSSPRSSIRLSAK